MPKSSILVIFDQNQLIFTLLTRIINSDMYLSTFVEDSVDMWYVTKSLKIDKIDDFSEI